MLGEERVLKRGVVNTAKHYKKMKRIQKTIFALNDYFLSSTFKNPLSDCSPFGKGDQPVYSKILISGFKMVD